VSDLHNQIFGIGESALMKKIDSADPDIIVVTGDVVDETHTSYSIALSFFEGAVKRAPVYYVTGNHEVRLQGAKMSSFRDSLRSLGVTILDDTYIDMGDYILAGISDASLDSFDAYPPFGDEKPVIMLAHEPQYFSLYQSLGTDLVLTGHYHGGQIIIPGVGGVVSPEFEFFPDMYEGMHTFGIMKLVLSRGLGNSFAPVRINNYPELVVVKVK
jgi:predicted MPP superfamily phosphohydrolase